MPKIIHPAILTQSSPLTFNVASTCDFGDPARNEMEQSDTPVQSVKDCVTRYGQFIDSKLSPADSAKIVRYSNFRVEDLLLMINQNQDCGFIRIYNGIDSDGSHFKIMIPVKQEQSGFVKQNEDTFYIMDCCRCPPNCTTDFGIQ